VGNINYLITELYVIIHSLYGVDHFTAILKYN